MTVKSIKKNSPKAFAQVLTKSSVFIVGMALIFAVPAAQAAGLKEIMERLAETAGSAAWLMQVGFMVVGIGLIGGGILGFIADAKQKGNGPISKGAALAMVLGGGLLAFMGSLVDTTGDTVWGDGKGNRGRIEISE